MLYTKGMPNQFLSIPQDKNNIQQVCYRILAQIAAKIGSVPWSLKEISGTIGQMTACSVLGISVQKCGLIYIVAGVLSVTKSMNKYTSHYYVGPNEDIGIKEVTKTALAAFYSAQNQLPNYLIVIREQLQENDIEPEFGIYEEACEELIDHIQLQNNKKLSKPAISLIVSMSQKYEKYFTQLANDFNPNYAKHPSVGTLITIDEDKNRYSLCTEREQWGCSYANQIQIYHQGNQQIQPNRILLTFYYQLIFLNFTLSNKTYLPAPIQYAWKLSSLLKTYLLKGYEIKDLTLFRKMISKCSLLYI